MRIYLYTRVSTDQQTHDSQLHELRAYCDKRGWKGVREITDTISGAKIARRGLDELMALVRRGKVEVIVCYKLDRLGRSLPHLGQLIAEFETHKTALIAPGQGIDTSSSNPAGRLQMHVLMAVAEFEREIIRERVNAGIAAARARGARFGRPETLFHHRETVAKLLGRVCKPVRKRFCKVFH